MKRNLRMHEHLKILRKTQCKIFLVLLFVAVSASSFSQQISASLLCSGGETFVTANQSLEFAIGEIATETYPSDINTLSQGFIQGTPEETDIYEDFLEAVNIKIFPNPSKGQMTLNCEIKPEYIEVIDLHGQVIFTIQNPEKSVILNIENLKSGIYLLKIIFEGNVPITKRIIKN